MRAMVLDQVRAPLVLKELPIPTPSTDEVLIKVHTCGVCRTDLHIVDGELPHPKLPLILGHQVVGVIEEIGANVTQYQVGDRVGVPWLGKCCEICEYCTSGKENLCGNALYTGYSHNGGYAEYCIADQNFILKLSSEYSDVEQAPLLCAGLIGYRAFRLANPQKTIGLYGFGSSAHILLQVANALGIDVFVFTRPGDEETQKFALHLGAKWAGSSTEPAPLLLDAAIIFAPVGALFPQALKTIKKGGKVISAGIHMSDIPSFPYSLLWEERSISSVANLTRKDGLDFLKIARQYPIQVHTTTFPLVEANQALDAIRQGKLEGSAVLII